MVQDALLALGVDPGRDASLSPDLSTGPTRRAFEVGRRGALDKLGGEQPILLSGDGTGRSTCSSSSPRLNQNLIFAPYSGLTPQEFDALSKIAPVVSFQDEPWTASWQDQVTIAGQALGKQAEAGTLIDKTNAAISATAAKNPALQGKTVTIGLPEQSEHLRGE